MPLAIEEVAVEVVQTRSPTEDEDEPEDDA